MKFFVLLGLIAVAAAAPQIGVGPRVYTEMDGRIVGGVDATPHAAPYIVSIRVLNTAGNWAHNCGGVIISPNNVLSAAHCISASQTILVAGAHLINTPIEGRTQTRDLLQTIAHPDYPGGNVVAPNDIAIFVPASPFDLTEWVTAAVLPAAGAQPTGSISLFGWGSTSNTFFPSMPNTLQTVDKPVIEINECAAIPRMVGTPLSVQVNICTGPLDSNVDACGGDSGGPLVQGSAPSPTVVGLVSWGWFPCGRGPSVATRVSAYIDWIASARVDG